jgi:formimidoylglutamate deiminase
MQWEKPQRLFAHRALTEQGWQRDVLVSVQDGIIADISPGAKPGPGTLSFDLLLPGMANVHSHAFQYAMAGMTESASPERCDNFWTWRELMYAFANALTPEQVETIAQALYIELLKHGYTAVGEFHYLHNIPGGKPYSVAAELSDRVISAAQATGIHLTHLPVLYESSDFGGVPATERQRRFVHSVKDYFNLLETLVQRCKGLENVVLGVAAHSLRAVTPESLKTVLEALPNLGLSGCPIHIHVAEQEKEVRDCLAWSGERPVAWLLAHMPVNEHWCLIHATHITPDEINAVVRSGAAVGLCPSTEANLGDGIFPAEAFLKASGRFGIGTDSNCCVSPFEELRLLEYAQRLFLRKRAVLYDEATPSVGRTLYTRAASCGARALGLSSGLLATGRRADLVALAAHDPLVCGKNEDEIFDVLIFGGIRPVITDVFVGGNRVISDGGHPKEEQCVEDLRGTLAALGKNFA